MIWVIKVQHYKKNYIQKIPKKLSDLDFWQCISENDKDEARG